MHLAQFVKAPNFGIGAVIVPVVGAGQRRLEDFADGLDILDGEPSGEIVVIVEPPEKQPEATLDDIDAFLGAALASMSVREAAAAAADALGVARKLAYQRALRLKAPA